MTILELFKTKTAEEIADEYMKERKSVLITYSKTPLYALLCDKFSDLCDCPEDCENYCDYDSDYDSYYDSDICILEFGKKCPYNIDRNEVLKREFIEWLNMEIPEVNE